MQRRNYRRKRLPTPSRHEFAIHSATAPSCWRLECSTSCLSGELTALVAQRTARGACLLQSANVRETYASGFAEARRRLFATAVAANTHIDNPPSSIVAGSGVDALNCT